MEYDSNIGTMVRNILHAYGFYPPDKIYADKLTQGRFVKYRNELDMLFPQAYNQKGVLGLSMASGDSRNESNYWKFDWNFTFLKNDKLMVKPAFEPWNVLSLDSTYGNLQNEIFYGNFFNCFSKLILLLKPFYAKIDDVSNSLKLLSKAHEQHFRPEAIQQIYWGNYFGNKHCQSFGKQKLLNMPLDCVSELGDGVFFSLTNHALDWNSKQCDKNRRIAKEYLGL